MQYKPCPRCRKYHFDNAPHTCPPVWLVWCKECDGDIHNAWPCHSIDAETAAEEWAEADDAEGDYTIVGGSEATVFVALQSEYDAQVIGWDEKVDADDRTVPPGVRVHKFVVYGETVAQYHARKVEDKQQ